MEQSEETFLCFSIGRDYFLVSLMDLDRIVSELPEAAVRVILGEDRNFPCFLLIQNGENSFALGADTAELVNIPSQCQFELPAEAVGSQNSFLSGVSYWEENNVLCFLLDCEQLWNSLPHLPQLPNQPSLPYLPNPPQLANQPSLPAQQTLPRQALTLEVQA